MFRRFKNNSKAYVSWYFQLLCLVYISLHVQYGRKRFDSRRRCRYSADGLLDGKRKKRIRAKRTYEIRIYRISNKTRRIPVRPTNSCIHIYIIILTTAVLNCILLRFTRLRKPTCRNSAVQELRISAAWTGIFVGGNVYKGRTK